MSGSNIPCDSAAMPLNRRSFLATAGATALVGCHRADEPTNLRILFGDGNGADSIAVLRLFTRALAKLNIQATIEVVSRGGGKLSAEMLAEGPRDGSMIAQLPSGLVYAQVAPGKGIRHDLASFEWIGSYAIDRRVLMVTREAGVTRFDQLFQRPTPITIPAGSVQGPAYFEAAIVRHLTGARIKAVPGFFGGARMLAVMSGEVDGTIGPLDSITKLLDLPGSRLLLRLNDVPLPPATPSVPAEGIPALPSLAKGPDAGPLCQLAATHAQAGRMLALPPGTPAEVVAAWRERFTQIFTDPDFRKDVARLRLDLQIQPGASLAPLMRELSARRAEIEPAVRRALAS